MMAALAAPLAQLAAAVTAVADAATDTGAETRSVIDWIATAAPSTLFVLAIIALAKKKYVVPEWTYREQGERYEKQLADERARHEKEIAARDIREAAKDEQIAQGQQVMTERIIPVLTRAVDAERERLDREQQQRRQR